tara:strand:+ start:583 stop:1002 length:420 start_codon:yes stop_codon:yes gene_type:complete
LSKSQYPVSITSYPPGASIVIEDKSGNEIMKSTTPTMVTLNAGNGYFSGASYTILFSKEGYETQIRTLTPSLDGWYIGNILVGGLIGMLIVDPVTGAMYKLDEKVNANLTSASETSMEGLQIIDIAQIPDEWNRHLIAL